MPGFYADGEYDIAGFIVGVGRASRRLSTAAAIAPGDVLIGLPSAGPAHQRLFAGAAGVFRDRPACTPDTFVPELGATVGDALLAPHRSYLPLVRPLLERGLVKGMAHITGGGITENLPRTLPEGCAAEVDLRSWTVPPIFRLLQDRGGIARDEMLRAFNMGVGMIVVCTPEDTQRAIEVAATAGEPHAFRLGRVVSGERGVIYV